MTLAEITGCDDRFLVNLDDRHRLHPAAADAFRRLQARAAAAGFRLQAVSCHRGFDRQLAIWNAKAAGRRPVLDARGDALDRARCDDWTWAQAILRWSALPGASRHHWGTDLDVYDAAAVGPDYLVQLTPGEVESGGPFCALHDWLDRQIAARRAEGFFRPYATDRGGVAPERWHISYAPVAAECERQLTESALFTLLDACPELALWPEVARHWPAVYSRFVQAPVAAPTGSGL